MTLAICCSPFYIYTVINIKQYFSSTLFSIFTAKFGLFCLFELLYWPEKQQKGSGHVKKVKHIHQFR
jgi:hypothetical protein